MAEIGKNVIENLTLGMYENSLMIYREYIQNAADAIDSAINLGILEKETAKIDIYINSKERNISIYDNATGISKDKFYKTLSSIADSEKDKSTDKGFRGIGRLAGLAYCEKLIFSTSYKGENKKSIMIWDGILLKNILNDKNYRIAASDLVDKVITYTLEDCDIDEHFFEVKLDNVFLENNELLDIYNVYEYLSFVAPVPYINSFIFRSKIYKFIEEKNLKLDEYAILVNGEQLFKPYKTSLHSKNRTYDEIKDIEFKEFYSEKDNNTLLAWMWFAVSKYEKNIPKENKMRAIRLRKENIQIGDETTLSQFFKETRGINYFIGELMAVNNELIPNARRDYFNSNETLRDFENSIKPFLYQDAYSLYHYANDVKLSLKKQFELQQKENDFKLKLEEGKFLDKDDELNSKKELEKELEKLPSIKKAHSNLEKKSKQSPLYTKVFNIIEKSFLKKDIDINNKDIIEENIMHTTYTSSNDNNLITKKNTNKKKKYKTQELSKYSKREQKLVTRIYNKIREILPKDMAENLIDKIQEDLKRE